MHVQKIGSRFDVLLPVVLLLAATVTRASASPLPCAEIVTDQALSAAVGVRVAAAAPIEREPGVTECSFSRPGASGNAVVSLRHFNRQAIVTNPVARTLEGYFELLVSAGEEVAGRKRESLSGGPRTALIAGNGQWLVIVQRPEGVVRVVVNVPGRPVAVAVARAVAG